MNFMDIMKMQKAVSNLKQKGFNCLESRYNGINVTDY